MARFRVSAHNLRVETGRYTGVPWEGRTCDLCNSQEVQDEHHVVFECSSTTAIRNRYSDLVDESDGQLSKLMLLDHAEVARFISECMKHIDDEYISIENDDIGDDENDEAFRDGEQQA